MMFETAMSLIIFIGGTAVIIGLVGLAAIGYLAVRFLRG